jgi:conjugal transfer pilus assembly protein TraV
MIKIMTSKKVLEPETLGKARKENMTKMNEQRELIKLSLLVGVFIISATLLSGCASMNSSFDCKMKPGVMCKNLDQVNRMVDQGKIGNPYAAQGTQSSGCKTCGDSSVVSASNANFQNISDFTTSYPNFPPKYGDPVRYGETVLRVWIAPYQDKDGNYYQPTTLYTIVKDGHWIGTPVNAIDYDGNNV